jgi:hypothetical protein
MVVTRVAQWATMPDGAAPGVRDSGAGMPGGTWPAGGNGTKRVTRGAMRVPARGSGRTAARDSGRRPAGPPRGAAPDCAILRSGCQLAEKGYRGTSLGGVAAAAGTTPPSLRRGFRSKPISSWRPSTSCRSSRFCAQRLNLAPAPWCSWKTCGSTWSARTGRPSWQVSWLSNAVTPNSLNASGSGSASLCETGCCTRSPGVCATGSSGLILISRRRSACSSGRWHAGCLRSRSAPMTDVTGGGKRRGPGLRTCRAHQSPQPWKEENPFEKQR